METVTRTLVAAALLLFGAAGQAQELRRAPEKVVGVDECGNCHESSVAAWKTTHHYSTYSQMHRSPEAREIAGKLGIKSMKRDSDCLTCHYTSQMQDGAPSVVAGISCESCHGAGRDWYQIHSDFGGEEATRETESAAHRDQRWAKSEAAGLIRPGNLYALAENCFQCHTVPNERIVNEGGHAAGSDFELVSWSQGEVRHNLWYNDGAENAEASANRKRMMFVVGQLLDLEYALRGLAVATAAGEYASRMNARFLTAAKRVGFLARTIKAPEIDAVIAAVRDAQPQIKPGNRGPLLATADAISAQSKKLAAAYDGSGFAALDDTIGRYMAAKRGEPYQP